MTSLAIAGHLGKKPELRSNDTTAWTSLSLAVNRGKDRDPEWFWVTAFGKLAETCCAHLEPGDGVAITGTIRSRRYEQSTRYDLIAHRATFFFKDRRRATGSVSGDPSRAATSDSGGAASDAAVHGDDEDEVPF